MILIANPQPAAERGWDKYGAGHFGASRGARTHTGEDYQAAPGDLVLSPVAGVVTKIGYPYKDDLSFRYVEVTCGEGLKHRLFYVQPVRLQVGDEVTRGEVLGTVQSLWLRYPGITEHVHYEIKTQDGRYIQPFTFQ